MHRRQRVARRQRDQLFALAVEERIGCYQKGARSLLDQGRECRLKIAFGARVEDKKLQPEHMRRPLDVSPIGLGNRIARVHEKSKNIGFRHQVVQQFHLLCHERIAKRAHSRDVPAGPIETGDKAKFDGITAGEKDNRNSCGPQP